MKVSTSLPLFAWLLLPAMLQPASARSENAVVRFNRDVQPILSDHCFQCHGPDEGRRKAKLRLDTREGLIALRDGVAVVAPGQPDRSLLMERVTASDPEDRMPPPEAKHPLSAAQIATLRAWIDQGAAWQDHWSFSPPRRPQPPSVRLSRWLLNPIDAFILARLEAADLTPNPVADRRTLIRRVTFDLTGLPPTPAEVEAFVQERDARAYERLVDRLLASERFGERMALAWMDAARYGDSSVFHADGERFMWPWRDWVIRAYNDNMPFDQFTIEQLAGDLLPEATLSQKVASGFNRNHGTTDEGGAIDEEYRVEYVVDRVKTTSTVWLGLTMECGQCHDHKYDPISQKEYYRFYAYFNQTTDRGMQTRSGNAEPFVYMFDADQQRAAAELARSIRAEEAAQAERRPAASEVEAWASLQREAPDPPAPALAMWRFLGPFTAADANQAFAKDFGPEARQEDFDGTRSYGKTRWSEPKDWADGEVISLRLPDNSAAYLFRTLSVPRPETYRVSLGSDDSIKAWLNGKEVLAKNIGRAAAADQDVVVLNLAAGENRFLMKIGNGGGDSGFYFKVIGSGVPDDIRDLTRLAALERTPEQERAVADYYAKTLWPEGLDRIASIQRKLKELATLRSSVPTSMIMEDRAEIRPTYLLARGHYESPVTNEVIQPGVPAALMGLPEDAPPNRLGMARWLTQPDHPLTARVAVNRYWAMLFGEGLVATVSDFGTRGAWPSHPELLDYLARDFAESGWDIKRAIRGMVMSATYRQSSQLTPGKRERDPQNRLLSRAPRLRLQGEFVRDNALALSGLLDLRVGGPSAKPYQPSNIWNEVSLDGNLRYRRDRGADLYRRSMYIFWKRSAPMPSMMAFDAPTREQCVVQRQRTNTPLQALVTLNDVQFVEAARLMAGRILREGGATFADRLNHAFLIATGRPADRLRQEVMGRLYDGQHARFSERADEARALLAFGDCPNDPDAEPAELAAWTVVASAVLNLDETLTKE